MNEWIKHKVLRMESFSDRPWYPFLIGFLAGLDNLVIVIPTDGIFVSSVLLQPRRWIRFAFAVTVGSTLGALALATIIQYQGLPLIETYFPSLMLTQTWLWTESLFHRMGLVVVFIVAALPVMQHPAIVLAALAEEKLLPLMAVILLGRILKYLILGWISAKAPRFLGRLWGLRKELEEVGIDTQKGA